MTFTSQDLRQLSELGISKERVLSQIEYIKKGFPFIRVVRSCTVGNGITKFEADQFDPLISFFDHAASNGRVMKFVPASGAASRMFHSLLHVYHHYSQYRDPLVQKKTDQADVKVCLDFIRNIEKFAFCEDLNDLKKLMESEHYDKILELVLTESGLNYAALPKALIKFHRYQDHTRTALEEHLTEALVYAKDAQNISRIHLSVSPEHRSAFEKTITTVRSRYEYSINKLEISYSEQKKSTDTIAVDMENLPFRDNDGKLVFRPAGHGALLENLNELNGDIIFLKNIDNVVPDHLKDTTYQYKKLLGGYLVQLQNQMFYYLDKMAQNEMHEPEIHDALRFAQTKLSVEFPSDFEKLPAVKKTEILFDKLDRPIRVCGMVRNQGEPGGGPFWVLGTEGSVSLQIVEKTQIDVSSDNQMKVWESSTHFNPVDLVCGVRDYKGENFDLRQFADQETGFISIKSKNGKPVKAVELPGLWNGSMAHWITVFVEVPLITFNPVKVINDLLRPEHQQKP